MPDLLTHVAASYGLQRGFRKLSYFFLIGTILPDILTRPFTILWSDSYWWTMPLHTPVGLFIVCAAISLLLPQNRRGRVFANLAAGAGLHVFLDMLQIHIAGSYYLLFPFSWHSYEFGVIWPETSLYLLPVWVALLAWLALPRLLRRRVTRSHDAIDDRISSQTRWT